MKKLSQIKCSTESIGYAHLGNGLTFWTRDIEENNDYKKICHADSYRIITWYCLPPKDITDYISNIVINTNPPISTSQQDIKVFIN